jgi:branched-chain amino acid transport system ATP-binding protein
LLSYADQRALEIGITIAGGAKVVLLDEPSSGMNRGEAERAVELISEITRGKSVALASRRL